MKYVNIGDIDARITRMLATMWSAWEEGQMKVQTREELTDLMLVCYQEAIEARKCVRRIVENTKRRASINYYLRNTGQESLC